MVTHRAAGVNDVAEEYRVDNLAAATPLGYKRTELNLIPSDWTIRELRELGRTLSGGTPRMSDQRFWHGSIPWVSSKDMKVLTIEDSIDHVTSLAIGQGTRLVEPGTILILVRGMTLAHSLPVGIVRRSLAFNQDLKAFLCAPKVHDEFVLRWLEANKVKILLLTTESTHGTKRLPTEDLLACLVALPPVEEQRAIAEALSDVDNLLESLDRLIAKKRAVKQAAMQQLLTGKTRLPGFDREWFTKRMGDIASIRMGRTPSRNYAKFWGQGFVWLSIADLKGKVINSSKEQVTDAAAATMKIVPKGTLLMSFKLSIGRLAFAGCDLFTNEAICSFHDLKADAGYIYYALQRTDFSLYGKQAVKGYTLNSESLKNVEVALPPKDEQIAIATALQDMDAEIERLVERRDKTEELKQGMMQQLLTGRIRLIKPDVSEAS